MKRLPIIPTRPTSERRAAAARANGAKSRGPVTAIGKANSSRNSHRHGLRSRTPLADPESAGQLTALLASFEREFQPHSEIEHTLIGTMALARWRRTCLWKLETSILNREIGRLKPTLPNEDPATLIALAFGSLTDHSCSLEIINRLESRCERQYDRAVDRLTALRAHGIFEKVNIHERSQQVVEKTARPTRSPKIDTAELQSAPEKVIVDARTRQAAENTTPPLHHRPSTSGKFSCNIGRSPNYASKNGFPDCNPGVHNGDGRVRRHAGQMAERSDAHRPRGLELRFRRPSPRSRRIRRNSR